MVSRVRVWLNRTYAENVFFMDQLRRNPSDRAVEIHATQTVLFNPPGVESALRPAMFATLSQTVTLHKRGGEWKITSFENEFVSMDSLTSR